MASYLDVLDKVATVIGGTQYTANGASRLFSGYLAGDSTGLTGLHGCYSVPPDTSPQDPPIALLVPSNGDYPEALHPGGELRNDYIHLVIVVPANDSETQIGILQGFVDAVPIAFQAHMTAFSALNVLDVYPINWQSLVKFGWGGSDHPAVDILLRVRRFAAATYTQ